MSRARSHIASGLEFQSRMTPTALLRHEDASGMCNTCLGELEPAEYLQRDHASMPPATPWRDLGAGAAVVFAVLLGLHFALVFWPVAAQVAAK